MTKEKLLEEVGRRLRERRKALGYTLEDVGAMAGVAKQTVSRMETGSVEALWTALIRVARSLGIPIETLTDGVPGVPPQEVLSAHELEVVKMLRRLDPDGKERLAKRILTAIPALCSHPKRGRGGVDDALAAAA